MPGADTRATLERLDELIQAVPGAVGKTIELARQTCGESRGDGK